MKLAAINASVGVVGHLHILAAIDCRVIESIGRVDVDVLCISEIAVRALGQVPQAIE